MVRWVIKEDKFKLRCYRNKFYLKVIDDKGKIIHEYRTGRIFSMLRELHNTKINITNPDTLEKLIQAENEAATFINNIGQKCIDIYKEYQKGVEKHGKHDNN